MALPIAATSNDASGRKTLKQVKVVWGHHTRISDQLPGLLIESLSNRTGFRHFLAYGLS